MIDTKDPDNSDRSDQLSPGRALRESSGATGGQRIGNNSPVANPTVTFPLDPPDDGASSGATGGT